MNSIFTGVLIPWDEEDVTTYDTMKTGNSGRCKICNESITFGWYGWYHDHGSGLIVYPYSHRPDPVLGDDDIPVVTGWADLASHGRGYHGFYQGCIDIDEERPYNWEYVLSLYYERLELNHNRNYYARSQLAEKECAAGIVVCWEEQIR